MESCGHISVLMDANAKLVLNLATDVFELIKTPVYDVEKANALEDKMYNYMNQLNQLKEAWARASKSLTDIKSTGAYACINKPFIF